MKPSFFVSVPYCTIRQGDVAVRISFQGAVVALHGLDGWTVEDPFVDSVGTPLAPCQVYRGFLWIPFNVLLNKFRCH